MEDRRFDSLAKMVSSGDSRRGILQTLGAGALAAVFGRLGLQEDAEARKKRKNQKKKKCKNGTTKCGKKACCRADQNCVNGKCIDDIEDPECQNDDNCGAGKVCQNGVCVDDGNECQNSGDCADNEVCINNACRCAFPNKPCFGACCPENQVCFNGQCETGEGTCPAGDSICNNDSEDACNGNNACFCVQRNDTEEARCIGGFLNDSRDNCTCIDDGDCERDFPGQGALCIQGGPGCQCQDTDSGRCAFLCPTQVGN
jgi:hypothetical protein